MRSRSGAWMAVHPLVVPVVCLLGGVLLAQRLGRLPLGSVLILAVLGVAWRRPLGGCVAALALGLVTGWVRLAAPVLEAPTVDPSRPVVALVRTTGAYRPVEGGWSAPARVLSLRQGAAVSPAPRQVWLSIAAQRAPTPVEHWARGTLRLGERPANDVPGVASFDRLRIKSERLLTPRSRRAVLLAPSRFGAWARERLDRMDTAEARQPGVQLALALVLGEPWRLEPEVRRALRVWGLAHLTAASGLHVGMIALACAGAGAWTPGARRWALPALAVVLYCGLVGGRPSLLRAASMLGLVWVARSARRSSSAIDGLAVAAAALVLVDPQVIDDLGFRLSFAATAGIVLYGPVVRRAWHRLPTWIGGPLSVSVSAQLFTAPLTISTFSTLPLAAPVLNLVFVPWTAVTLLVSFVWVGMRSLGMPIGSSWLAPSAVPFELLAGLPAPPWIAPTVVAGLAPATAAATIAGLLLSGPRPGRRLFAAAALACVPWLSTVNARARDPELWMLDVGQGDAFVLRSGSRVVLVDGGGWRGGDFSARVLLPSLSRIGVRRIDLAVLSHADLDHCGGLLGVAGRLPIAELWVGSDEGEGSCGEDLVSALDGRVRRVAGGERAQVGAWRLEVAPRVSGGGANRGSVVVRASAAGRAILFTGDLDAEGEGSLRRSGFDLRADVLKVAHHGSRTSSETRFLEAVSPRYALISAGRENSYGHPAPVVTERLRRCGATVLRSDLDGRVVLRFPGAGPIRFETERLRTWRDGGPR